MECFDFNITCTISKKCKLICRHVQALKRCSPFKMALSQLRVERALFPKSTIKQQLPQPLVTATLGAF